MRFFLFIVLIFLSVVLQVSFFSHLELFNAIPNLILVSVVIWCILKKYRVGFLWAILGGALLDLYSSSFFGVHMISLLVTCLVVYFLVINFINIDSFYSRGGIIIFSTVFYRAILIIFYVILRVFKVDFADYLVPTLGMVLGEILLNTVLMVLFYRFIRAVNEFVLRYEERIKSKA